MGQRMTASFGAKIMQVRVLPDRPVWAASSLGEPLFYKQVQQCSIHWPSTISSRSFIS